MYKYICWSKKLFLWLNNREITFKIAKESAEPDIRKYFFGIKKGWHEECFTTKVGWNVSHLFSAKLRNIGIKKD